MRNASIKIFEDTSTIIEFSVPKKIYMLLYFSQLLGKPERFSAILTIAIIWNFVPEIYIKTGL